MVAAGSRLERRRVVRRGLAGGPRARRLGLLLGVAVVGVAALLLELDVAEARPGGGHTYSGGSRSSSSGSYGASGGGGSYGGGDGGALGVLLGWLYLEHPLLSVPLTLVGLAGLLWHRRLAKLERDWMTHGVESAPAVPRDAPLELPKLTSSLAAVRALDEHFSQIVFEDFLHALYVEVQLARGAGALDRLSAHLTPAAAQALRQSTVGPVQDVIVGAMKVAQAGASREGGARVGVEFRSNYTEAGRGYYVVELWLLTRQPSATSRPPDRARVFGCPSCGAPQEALFGGGCRFCGRLVNDGSFDWVVLYVTTLRREATPPPLVSDVQERGTELPTQRDPGLEDALRALSAKDPAFELGQLQARIGLIFHQFQRAWSTRELRAMRPFLSDALFMTQEYWIRAYQAAGLWNLTEGAQVTGLDLVKVDSDAYFDAVTVRLYATGLDYTLSREGRLVSGSRSVPRPYSEYWTLIRGASGRGPARAELRCPRCGAPLAVNMAGHCDHCRAKITRGDFDWVLSRIEQDEEYRG